MTDPAREREVSDLVEGADRLEVTVHLLSDRVEPFLTPTGLVLFVDCEDDSTESQAFQKQKMLSSLASIDEACLEGIDGRV